MASNHSLITFVLFAVSFVAGCSKALPTEVMNERSNSNGSQMEPQDKPELATEVSVTVDLFKKGETNVYRIELSQIPDAPPLADVYWPLNASYQLSSNAIATNGIATFIVPVSDEQEFDHTRVLRLDKDDMFSSGYGWLDCTVSKREKPNDEESNRYGERFAKFLPDYSQKKISCEFGKLNGPDSTYFTVVERTEEPPNVAFTKIVPRLDRIEKIDGSDETVYTVSISNEGPKVASEINFFSNFDQNFRVVAAEPSAGMCRRLSFGTGFGAMACFLGRLAPAEKVVIKFRGTPLNFPGRTPSDNPNKNWMIVGYAKEKPNDPLWPPNRFTLDPLMSKK